MPEVEPGASAAGIPGSGAGGGRGIPEAGGKGPDAVCAHV